ncbi:MAG: radical SAM protein [bacterium]|nr:radical SAM protein [bacterium]
MRQKKSHQLTRNGARDEIFYHYARDDVDREKIDRLKSYYRTRVTPFLKKLAGYSEAVRLQYLPQPRELDTVGTTATPFEEGKSATKTHGLERLYRDRVLMTPHFDCPVYCRFCYKKSRVLKGHLGMTHEEIDQTVEEVGRIDEVRGVLITGGDPMMNPKKLFYLLDGLMELDNIHEIRIGSRSPATLPSVFTDKVCDRLASYIRPNFLDPSKSKYLAINVHFNHPDELAPETLEACYKLTSRGITLRNQTVLLKGINDNIETITRLFNLLLRNNMITYYLNHCMPVEGSDHLRTSVQKGLDILKRLCTESSTAIPHYVYAPEGGKIHVGPDTTFDYVYKDGLRYIRDKMLYKADEFRRITNGELPKNHGETEDGYIESLYLDGYDD